MKQDYICAIPLFGTRVAPRCMYSVTMLVAGVRGKEVSFRRSVSTEELDEYRWLEQLLDLEVDIIVCGGISPHIHKLLGDYGIKVVSNVAGEAQEVLSALVRGELHPWFGYYEAEGGEKKSSGTAGILSEPFPATAQGPPGFNECERWRTAELESGVYAGDSLVARTDFSMLGSVAEFKSTAHSEGYSRVGLVYCALLSGWAGSVNDLLSETLNTCMLVCPARCTSGAGSHGSGDEVPCSPGRQAEQINQADCDLVMIIGHCPAFQAELPGMVRARSAVLLPKGKEKAASKGGMGK